VAIVTGRTALDVAPDGFPVTPSDSVDLAVTARALLVSVGGTLQITTSTGQTRALTVPAGVVPIRTTRVWLTNTAATGITALV